MPVKRDRVPFDAERAEHGAEREVEVEEHRPLLDVELEVGRRRRSLAAALLDPLEVDADVPQRVRQADALLVDEPPRLVEVEVAGAGRGAEEALAKAGSLLVGPVDHADGDGWLPGVLRTDPPEHLDAGKQAEAAVEPAAVGNGVDVAADHDRAVGRSGQCRPEVAGGVLVDLNGKGKLDVVALEGTTSTASLWI